MAIIKVGGLVDATTVTLGVYGLDLDPAAVTALLGREATTAFRKGDAFGSRGTTRPRGAWLVDVQGVAPVGPEELATGLLSTLTADPAAWATLTRDYEVQLRVGVRLLDWNRGFDLSAAFLSRLGGLGVPMVFDIYMDEEGDDAVSITSGAPRRP